MAMDGDGGDGCRFRGRGAGAREKKEVSSSRADLMRIERWRSISGEPPRMKESEQASKQLLAEPAPARWPAARLDAAAPRVRRPQASDESSRAADKPD
mmetsp:Transcript_6634/g.13433  ORF Transcript_6634/g.13433 Transcript_6634/m.13433 type:complete len:98 (-) Transcript_6634:226-519(-)